MQTAVELNDLSILAPMSVRDAIWVDYALMCKRKRDVNFENDKIKFIGEQFQSLNELLLDVREVSLHTDTYVQIAAMKGGKHAPKIEPIKLESLPSSLLEKARKEREEEKKPKPKKKKYATYREYLENEEKDRNAEQDRLFKMATAFDAHMKDLERRQGGLDKSKAVRELESEEERLRKIREERRLKEEAEKERGNKSD